MEQLVATSNLPSEGQLAHVDADALPALKMVQHILSLSRAETLKIFDNYCSFLQNVSAGQEYDCLDPRVDALWHIHIIDMERYCIFCERRFGHVVLHRLPDEPLELDWLAYQRSAINTWKRKLEGTSSPSLEHAAMAVIAAGGQCRPVGS